MDQIFYNFLYFTFARENFTISFQVKLLGYIGIQMMNISMKMDGFLLNWSKPPLEPLLMDQNGLKSIYQEEVQALINGLSRI